MNIFRGLFFSLTFGLASVSAFAIPALQNVRTVSQPDGSTLRIKVVGDEFTHFTTTENGSLLVLDDDGFYRLAALDASGLPVSSGLLPGEAAALGREVRLSEVNFNSLQGRSSVRRAPQSGKGLMYNNYPTVGNPKALIILVEYADVKFNNKDYDAVEYFNNMINGENFTDFGGTGSALQYFRDQSHGRFVPDFDVLGPVTLPYNQGYYGGNSSYDVDINAHLMVPHALEILDPTVDFSVYDTNKDGLIDNIYIFYAGQSEADYGGAECVWPHNWDIRGAGINCVVDGVKAAHYACSNEWGNNNPSGVGVFVHEFCHVMGLPDLYSTNRFTDFTPKIYSVLDYGPYNNDSRTPPNFGAFERNALGWSEPIMLDSPMSVQLSEVSSGQFGLIPTKNSNEFYLLENRQLSGWDKYIPNHGLLVWHIDYDPFIFENNTVNNMQNHQYVDIVEANGETSVEFSEGFTFPGTSGKTEFTSSTSPALKTWSGSAIDLPITGISDADGIVSFDVAGGGALLLNPETSVGESSLKDGFFVAKWQPVEGAVEYFITVYSGIQGKNPLSAYNNLSVGNATELKVENLGSSSSLYSFIVTASDGTLSRTSSLTQVVLTDGTTDAGVDFVLDGNDTPVYYNLQGLRLDYPVEGTLVIEVKGNSAKKIIFRK